MLFKLSCEFGKDFVMQFFITVFNMFLDSSSWMLFELAINYISFALFLASLCHWIIVNLQENAYLLQGVVEFIKNIWMKLLSG